MTVFIESILPTIIVYASDYPLGDQIQKSKWNRHTPFHKRRVKHTDIDYKFN